MLRRIVLVQVLAASGTRSTVPSVLEIKAVTTTLGVSSSFVFVNPRDQVLIFWKNSTIFALQSRFLSKLLFEDNYESCTASCKSGRILFL